MSTVNTDPVIPTDLVVKIRRAEDNLLGVEWTLATLRKLKVRNETQAVSVQTVEQMLREFADEAHAALRETRLELDKIHGLAK